MKVGTLGGCHFCNAHSEWCLVRYITCAIYRRNFAHVYTETTRTLNKLVGMAIDYKNINKLKQMKCHYFTCYEDKEG